MLPTTLACGGGGITCVAYHTGLWRRRDNMCCLPHLACGGGGTHLNCLIGYH